QIVSQRHDRLSVIGSLAVSPRRRQVKLRFRVHDHNVRTADVVRYLYALHWSNHLPIAFAHGGSTGRAGTSHFLRTDFS
ncbi:MAG: hypothetical protein K1X74_21320, partial [Pirellulales bacterium]|nr:hypothetical protein [Pirellulales bacterium]